MHHTQKALEHNDEQAAKITLTIEREIDEHITSTICNHLYRSTGELPRLSGWPFPTSSPTWIDSTTTSNITKGILPSASDRRRPVPPEGPQGGIGGTPSRRLRLWKGA
jgi:hypothetical protein